MQQNSKPSMFWTNEKRKLSDLKPWQRNPRQIKDKQAKLLAESFSDFGQVETIAISANGDIYNGHQRLSVLAGKYGMDYEVDVRVSSRDLTEKERERLTVYLHRGATGEWDFDELANWDMSDLLTWGFEESDFPFDVAPATNEGADAEPQTDKAEELRQKWNVQSGQMWQLGEHRIVCGDCTDRAVVERVMGGEKAELCLTDPPYGIEDTASDKNNYDEYVDTKDNLNKLINGFLPLAMSIAKISVITPGNENQRLYPVPTWTMAWFTPAGVGSGPWGFCCWQPILCYGKDPKLAAGKGRHPDAIVHTEASEDFGHPCPKPVKFWEWLAQRTSEIGNTIYEPFSGSGTTLIACENLSRRCRAVEISPAYVAVAIQRWVDVTGKEPILLDA